MKEALASNFYFDLAGPWPVTSAIPALLRWIDYAKLLWGTDTPWTPLPASSAVSAAFDKDIETTFAGDDDAEEKVYAVRKGNAEDLFD